MYTQGGLQTLFIAAFIISATGMAFIVMSIAKADRRS